MNTRILTMITCTCALSMLTACGSLVETQTVHPKPEELRYLVPNETGDLFEITVMSEKTARLTIVNEDGDVLEEIEFTIPATNTEVSVELQDGTVVTFAGDIEAGDNVTVVVSTKTEDAGEAAQVQGDVTTDAVDADPATSHAADNPTPEEKVTPPFTTVAISHAMACALDTAGQPWCWAFDHSDSGQMPIEYTASYEAERVGDKNNTYSYTTLGVAGYSLYGVTNDGIVHHIVRDSAKRPSWATSTHPVIALHVEQTELESPRICVQEKYGQVYCVQDDTFITPTPIAKVDTVAHVGKDDLWVTFLDQEFAYVDYSNADTTPFTVPCTVTAATPGASADYVLCNGQSLAGSPNIYDHDPTVFPINTGGPVAALIGANDGILVQLQDSAQVLRLVDQDTLLPMSGHHGATALATDGSAFMCSIDVDGIARCSDLDDAWLDAETQPAPIAVQ